MVIKAYAVLLPTVLWLQKVFNVTDGDLWLSLTLECVADRCVLYPAGAVPVSSV